MSACANVYVIQNTIKALESFEWGWCLPPANGVVLDAQTRAIENHALGRPRII